MPASGPAVKRFAPTAPKVRACIASAREAIGTIEPGMRLVGLTKGQFGQIDILRAIALHVRQHILQE